MKKVLHYVKNSRRTQVTIALLLTVGFILDVITYRRLRAPTTPPAFAETTAMITNPASTSGGSGVVVESTDTESSVLTNAHVCEVIERGGLVHTATKRAAVKSYKVSETHDLCLIKVQADLEVSTGVAKSAPPTFSKASIAGHPALLPTIITQGHFSHKMIIEVLAKIKKCEQKDFEGDLGFLCIFLGGIPIVKIYEAQPVSATIQPGSSGSAVFNEAGEIAGLVFAGAGQLSYGFVVPQEYIKEFLQVEVKNLPELKPNTELTLDGLQMKIKLKKACRDRAVPEEATKFCTYLDRDTSILSE